jgi:hypothetical protein
LGFIFIVVANSVDSFMRFLLGLLVFVLMMMSYSALVRRSGFFQASGSNVGSLGRSLLRNGANHSVRPPKNRAFLALASHSFTSSRSVSWPTQHPASSSWRARSSWKLGTALGSISSTSEGNNKVQIRWASTSGTSNLEIATDQGDLPPVDWDEALQLISKARENMTADQLSQASSSELRDLALRMAAHFAQRGKIPLKVMDALLDVSIERCDKLPNVIPVNRSVKSNGERGSVVVVGDTHGQFLDFHFIIQKEVAGTPSDDNRFVINGDIVDRGSMSIEILAVLLTLKLACDSSITILRGNHETTGMNRYYGFEKEVLSKFDRNKALLEKFRTLFATLPLASVIENSVFVVHGGLGRQTSNMTLSELNALDRKTDHNEDSVSELLWGGE